MRSGAEHQLQKQESGEKPRRPDQLWLMRMKLHNANQNKDDMQGYQQSKKQMSVDSFSHVSEHGAKNSLKIDQSSGDGAKPAESATVGDRLVAWFAIPIRRSENSQTHRQGKKGLGKRSVNNRQCVLKQNDPQAANNTLENHQQQSHDSKPAHPMTAFPEPKCQGQRDSQQPDG